MKLSRLLTAVAFAKYVADSGSVSVVSNTPTLGARHLTPSDTSAARTTFLVVVTGPVLLARKYRFTLTTSAGSASIHTRFAA